MGCSVVFVSIARRRRRRGATIATVEAGLAEAAGVGASVFQYFPNQANNRSQGTGWRIAVSDRQQQQPLASTQGSEIKNFIRKLFGKNRHFFQFIWSVDKSIKERG